MNQNLFITSSGTGLGKTLVTAALTHQLRMAGKRVSAIKPVISGFSENDPASDTAQLLAAMGMSINPVTVEAVSPWRFAAPLAAPIAAAREGKIIPFDEVVEFCTMPRTSEITLIEGAGGVMAPLTSDRTMLDLITAISCPVILVVGTYLGALSHALTAAEALHARGVRIQAILISESREPVMRVEEVAASVRPFVPYAKHLVALPHVAGGPELWQDVANLTWMLS